MSDHEDVIEMLEDIAEDLEHGDKADVAVAAILYIVANALATGQIYILGAAVMECAHKQMAVMEN